MKRWIALAMLGAGGLMLSVGLPAWSRSHDEAFTDEGLRVASADDLKATVVTPHLEAPIEAGHNVLWCGTFQLVWNEMCSLIGEDIHFTDDPPMVGPMNRKAFTRTEVDAASYVALAGFVGDGIFEKIPQALRERFKGKATPRYLPPRNVTPRPQDIVGYAYLFKHLEFAMPFERLEQPLDFGGTALPAFGLLHYKAELDAMYGQVAILDYAGPDDFVIELKTKATGDRLILAKVTPQATLGETVARVLGRAGGQPVPAQPGDLLAVPLANFDVTREYRELYSRPGGLLRILVVTNPDIAKDLMVLSAVQNIRFQMDEKGVSLRSESHMSFGCSAEARWEPQHVMIFDKPFLVLMKRVDAQTPYFAMWVENPELLVPLNAR